MAHQLPITCPADLKIQLAGLSSPLFEYVDDVDRLGEASDVEHSECLSNMYPNFRDPRPNGAHGLPIQGFASLLHEMELVPGLNSRLRRKCPHGGVARPEPPERFQ
jgi:hypothetical protein